MKTCHSLDLQSSFFTTYSNGNFLTLWNFNTMFKSVTLNVLQNNIPVAHSPWNRTSCTWIWSKPNSYQQLESLASKWKSKQSCPVGFSLSICGITWFPTWMLLWAYQEWGTVGTAACAELQPYGSGTDPWTSPLSIPVKTLTKFIVIQIVLMAKYLKTKLIFLFLILEYYLGGRVLVKILG